MLIILILKQWYHIFFWVFSSNNRHPYWQLNQHWVFIWNDNLSIVMIYMPLRTNSWNNYDQFRIRQAIRILFSQTNVLDCSDIFNASFVLTESNLSNFIFNLNHIFRSINKFLQFKSLNSSLFTTKDLKLWIIFFSVCNFFFYK